MNMKRRIVSLGIIFVVLVGTLHAKSNYFKDKVIYRESFDEGPGTWGMGKDSPTPGWHKNFLGYHGVPVPLKWNKTGGRSGGFSYSESPWYFDDNHGLYAWLYLTFFAYSKDVGIKGVDLRNAEVKVSLRLRDIDLKGTRLLFWIQGPASMVSGCQQGCDYMCNWTLSSQPIKDELLDGEWHDVSLTLANDEGAWSFMGLINGGLRGKVRVVHSLSSGDGTLEQILAGQHLNWGILLFGVDPVDPPTGKIDIDEFSITAAVPK